MASRASWKNTFHPNRERATDPSGLLVCYALTAVSTLPERDSVNLFCGIHLCVVENCDVHGYGDL